MIVGQDILNADVGGWLPHGIQITGLFHRYEARLLINHSALLSLTGGPVAAALMLFCWLVPLSQSAPLN